MFVLGKLQNVENVMNIGSIDILGACTQGTLHYLDDGEAFGDRIPGIERDSA